MSLNAVYNLFKRTFNRFFAEDTFEMGAALAYYTVFSLAPLVLIAISIAGMVFGQQAAEGQISQQIESAVGPTVAQAIQEMLKNARESGSSTTASIIGVVVLLLAASGVFVQLQSALNKIWRVPPQESGGVWSWIKNRLLTFAMVLAIGFLLLVSLIVSTAIAAASSYLAPGETTLSMLINQVVSFVTITVLFALIFKYLPDRHVQWRDVWIGAALTALLFVVGKYLLGLYLGQKSVTSAYGAAGSLVLILMWVYYASQILLFGAQFTQVYATRGDEAQRQLETGHAAAEKPSTEAARDESARVRA